MASLSADLRKPYKIVDGKEIPTDIYLPKTTSSSTQACPVLLMIHGGAFMLGHAGMNNKDQIQDCLERGWIVLALEHRLCPGVNLLEGPMTDVRDALAWAQSGGLNSTLGKEAKSVKADEKRVVLMGTSSGGNLALSTAWDTLSKPLAILDFYGAKHFADPFWSKPLEGMPAHFSDALPTEQSTQVQNEKFVLIGGVSLEGQSGPPPEEAKIRTAFAMNALATGKVIPTIYPPSASGDGLKSIDPVLNVEADWPPIAIVHGTADTMVPMRFSRELEAKLNEKGVRNEFIEVEGEPHTFCGKMEKGSKTWDTQRKGFDFLERIIKESY
ncbi:hypothetical protein ACN47E_009530 [Coniothyrium glycines]